MSLLARLLAILGIRREAPAEPLAPPLPQAALYPPVHAIGDPGWGEERLILPGRPDPAPPAPALVFPEPAMTALPFAGAARPLSAIDISRAAQALGCEVEAVQAVRTVEAGGSGFLGDGSGRPLILYEAHRFAQETGGRFSASHPRLSTPVWDRSLYLGGAREYDRLQAAIVLDRVGALRATSWGLFQILGSNHRLAGYPDVESYVAGMAESEGAHLDAFVAFCRAKGLDAALRRRDWAAFARGYNGTAYAANAYDTKLAEAYRRAKGMAVSMPAALRIGMRSEAVRRLQAALAAAGYRIGVDGIFGRATEIVVEQFQAARRLVVDGVAGPQTLGALGVTSNC